jgi:dinuclear metal center YbgI/SA1388 family protein
VGATLQDVIGALELAYPPALAESWDTGIGLTCGDRADPVSAVLLAVDIDDNVITQAMQLGAQLIVTHHPLLFRPLQSVAADLPKGGLVTRLIRSGIAHYSAHTNADKAAGGVNDALAGVLGLEQVRPLVPDPTGMLPVGHLQAGRTGSGRFGRLPAPVALGEFAELVGAALPWTAGGVRVAGDPARMINTVALCGGAGDSQLDSARGVGADVYLTSDLRHHVVIEHLAVAGSPAVVDVAHWAGEWPWLARAAEVVAGTVGQQSTAGTVTVTVSSIRTDPWTLHRPSTGPHGE